MVDDVEEQRNIADKILTKLGYSVVSSASGEEAVEYMQKQSTDLVNLDMIMDPGMDGLETYRRIIDRHAWCCLALVQTLGSFQREQLIDGRISNIYIKNFAEFLNWKLSFLIIVG